MATTNINVKIPYNPMTMLSEGNNEFTIVASVIARASGTPVHGNPITWTLLTPSSDHEYSFYRNVKGNTSTQQLEIRFPKVKNVLTSLMTSDESLVAQFVQFGSTTGIQSTNFTARRPTGMGLTLRGNGTSWTVSNAFGNGNLQINSVSSGRTAFDLGTTQTGFDSNSVSISYVGTNNYRIERLFSGIPGSAGLAFYMIDIATNTRVTTAPTSNDAVLISNTGQGVLPVGLGTWLIANNQLGNLILENNNFWCIGMYELWMKAAAISTTEIKVKWQAKSGVTQYKLLRSTAFTVDSNGDYVLTTPTTVYTGTDLSYVDTGLTADTMYYYQLTDQSDVEITQFNTKTK